MIRLPLARNDFPRVPGLYPGPGCTNVVIKLGGVPKESRDAAPCRLVQEITKKDSAESQPFRLPLCQKGATDLRVLVDCLQYEKMLRLCPWIHLFVGQVCQSRCRFVGLAGTA